MTAPSVVTWRGRQVAVYGLWRFASGGEEEMSDETWANMHTDNRVLFYVI